MELTYLTAPLPLLYPQLITLITVYEGSPICKCLHSGIQLSLQGHLPLLGHDCGKKETQSQSKQYITLVLVVFIFNQRGP